MKYEKSCGAVIYMEEKNKTLYLIIKSIRDGHIGFPKGHVEEGETEKQTAIREVMEETGLNIKITQSFREKCEYSPAEGVWKESVYFLAKVPQKKVVIQEEEIEEYKWGSYDDIKNDVTYKNDRDILQKADRFISEMRKKQGNMLK